jgi:hypothetical protein
VRVIARIVLRAAEHFVEAPPSLLKRQLRQPDVFLRVPNIAPRSGKFALTRH